MVCSLFDCPFVVLCHLGLFNNYYILSFSDILYLWESAMYSIWTISQEQAMLNIILFPAKIVYNTSKQEKRKCRYGYKTASNAMQCL